MNIFSSNCVRGTGIQTAATDDSSAAGTKSYVDNEYGDRDDDSVALRKPTCSSASLNGWAKYLYSRLQMRSSPQKSDFETTKVNNPSLAYVIVSQAQQSTKKHKNGEPEYPIPFDEVGMNSVYDSGGEKLSRRSII